MNARLRRITLGLLVAAIVVVFSSAGAGQASPADGRIVFWDFTTGQVYSVNPNGSGLRQLTHTGSKHLASWPDFSPNGRHVIFSLRLANADGNDQGRIWIMNANGSNPHQLSHDRPGYRDYDPRYTPDGRHIVFARCLPNDGVCAISEIRSDGTDMRALTHFKTGMHEAVDFNVAVAPTGQIAFARFGAGGIISQLWIMHPDGSDQHPITPPALEATGANWSPSARQIIFNTNSNRSGSAIWVTNPAGTARHPLTHPPFPHNDIAPTYAPSGSRIAFTSDRAHSDLCCLDLYVVNADGSNRHRITTSLAGIIDPIWGRSP
jgi:Tol biopolymer transport system component